MNQWVVDQVNSLVEAIHFSREGDRQTKEGHESILLVCEACRELRVDLVRFLIGKGVE